MIPDKKYEYTIIDDLYILIEKNFNSNDFFVRVSFNKNLGYPEEITMTTKNYTPSGAVSYFVDSFTVPGNENDTEKYSYNINSTTIPGLTIKFEKKEYQFTLSQVKKGIKIGYKIIAEKDFSGIITLPQDTGGCENPGKSGLIVHETLSGNNQYYSIDDTGLCPDSGKRKGVTIKKGEYSEEFLWDGVNWRGPSDTGNKKGLLFPVGIYQLKMRSIGYIDKKENGKNFEIVSTVKVILIE